MEQTQYWMWMKRRQFWKSNFQVWKSSISDSWEEKAFAEDACGNLGGCIWPPRSYSCSFCKREFRSAQALGGHMNVHRRDRARLKQSLSPQNDLLQYQNHQNHSHANFPTEVCTLDFGLHPNFIGSSTAAFLSSSRVSAQENLSDHTFVSSNKVSTHNYDQSGSDSLAVVENPREETCLNDDYFVETDLLMGFNSAESPNSPTGSYGDISCKRPKTISFSMKPCSSDRYSFRSEITEANSNSTQDIDLELRLGEPPKVK